MKILLKPFSLLVLTIIAVLLFSCKKKIETRSDLITYINDPDNGLLKTQQIGQVKSVLTYKPSQIAIFSETKNKNTSLSAVKDKLFFVLSLSANNKEVLRQLQFAQYSEMVQVMAFRMNDFIEINPDNKEGVKPLECLFQQTYGMSNANNLLIIFNREKLIDADNLKIKIKEFGLNIGNLIFEIKTKNIKEIQNVVLK